MSDKQRTGSQRNLRGRTGDDLLSPGAAWNCEILENTKCAVQCALYTDCIFIKNMIENGKPEQWKRAEWRKPSGKEVKNQELWQQYQTLSERHEIAVRFSKHHDYVEKLEGLLEEKQHV